jgi:hypothetical protein
MSSSVHAEICFVGFLSPGCSLIVFMLSCHSPKLIFSGTDFGSGVLRPDFLLCSDFLGPVSSLAAPGVDLDFTGQF